MIAAGAVLSAMLELPVYYGDRDESAGDRIALYYPIAVAIAEAALTPRDAAALVTLASHETHFARAVVEGHCDLMPRGQRCDSGRARGVFQLHRAACAEAYRFDAGSLESLRAEARCALGQLRFAMKRCRGRASSEWAGAFSGYGSASCAWPPARRRVETLRTVLANWRAS